MKCAIEISMDNAAFGDEPGIELGRILHDVADELSSLREEEIGTRNVRDVNGNAVGKVTIAK